MKGVTMRLVVALWLVVAGAAACRGAARVDNAPLDASDESTDAGPIGNDSSLDTSTPQDATAHEGASDASTSDAADAHDATTDSTTGDADAEAEAEAGPHPPCDDLCVLGSQQCGLLPQVCTYDDAGYTASCQPQAEGIWTCEVGATGCTVWSNGAACRPDVPCCVACQAGGTCPGACPLGLGGNPCQQDTDCASNACGAFNNQCVSNQCADGRQDGAESDVDCGGLDCNGCGPGKRCQGNGDCFPGYRCANNVCTNAAPDASTGDGGSSCDDACELGNQQCQSNAIVTCVVGGSGCTVWAPAGACRADVPCCTSECQPGTCPATCPLGAVGNPCQQDTDCASDACDAITLTCVSDHCADHRQDGFESDVDCGGGCFDACGPGQRCQNNGDCQPGHACLGGATRVCSGAVPDASVMDAAEEPSPCTDACVLGNQACSLLPQVCTHDDAGFTVSCDLPVEGTWTCVTGAAGCTVWAPGAACGPTCCAGCQQAACDAGAASSCWVCPAASDGNPCESDTDCASAACDAVSHECVAKQCADHRQDGQETDVDCGGPSCSPCGSGQRCGSNVDCKAGHVCVNGYGGGVCS